MTNTDLPRWRATAPFVGKNNIQYGRGTIVQNATKPGPFFVALDPRHAAEFVAPPNPTITEGEAPPFAGLYRIGTNADGTAKWSTRPPFPDVIQAIQDTVVPRYQFVGEQSAAMIAGDLRRRYESFDSLFWPTEPGMEPVNASAKLVTEYFQKNSTRPDLPFHAWNVERNCVNTIQTDEARGHTPTPTPGPHFPPRYFEPDASHPKYQRRGDRDGEI